MTKEKTILRTYIEVAVDLTDEEDVEGMSKEEMQDKVDEMAENEDYIKVLADSLGCPPEEIVKFKAHIE